MGKLNVVLNCSTESSQVSLQVRSTWSDIVNLVTNTFNKTPVKISDGCQDFTQHTGGTIEDALSLEEDMDLFVTPETSSINGFYILSDSYPASISTDWDWKDLSNDIVKVTDKIPQSVQLYNSSMSENDTGCIGNHLSIHNNFEMVVAVREKDGNKK